MRRCKGLSRAVAVVIALAAAPAAACGSAADSAPAQTGAAALADRVAAASRLLPAPADLPGTGWRMAGPTVPAATSSGAAGAEPAWPWALPRCVLYRAADYPAQRHRQLARRQTYAAGARRALTATVEGFEPGWALHSLADVERVTRVCERYEHGDAKTGYLEAHTLTLEAFAGDGSLLLETVRIGRSRPTDDRLTAVVRRGDTVITLSASGIVREEVVALARTVADRA